MKKYLFVLLSVIIMTGCSDETFVDDAPVITEKLPVFTASMESSDSTRAYLDGNHIYWKEGDQISVFVKSNTNSKYQLSAGEGTKNGTFKDVSTSANADNGSTGTRVSGADCKFNGAVYPYNVNNAVAAADNGLTFTFSIAYQQTYTPGTFDPRQFPMLAVSDNENLQFKNVCGMLKLQLKGSKKISKIELRGNNNEPLAGTAHSTMIFGGMPDTKWDNTSGINSVTLSCNDTQLTEKAASFFLTLRPTVFEKGFRVMLTDSEGHRKVLRKTKNTPTINRNDVLVMPETTCEFTQTVLKSRNTITWGFTDNAPVMFKSGQHSNMSSGTNIAESGNSPVLIQGANVRTSADEMVLNADCSSMFASENISSVAFDICNTSHVTNMNGMFKDCKNLTKADLSDFNTSKVTNFAGMFANVGFSTTEGSEIILGPDFIINDISSAASMFAGAKIKSITCTAALKDFIQQNGEALGFGKGNITWYDYSTGEQGEISITVEGTKQLVITHNLTNFAAPTLTGTFTDGKVKWDDSATETQFSNGASHEYTSQGEHKVTISAKKATGFEMKTLNGIEKIDLSNFK